MHRLFLIALLVLACALPMLGQSDTIFDGHPYVRVITDVDSANRALLTADETLEFRTRIVKNGDNYFWESRGGRPLIYIPPRNPQAIYHYSIEPSGAGYIEVEKIGSQACVYYEEISLGMTVYIYRGSAVHCLLQGASGGSLR